MREEKPEVDAEKEAMEGKIWKGRNWWKKHGKRWGFRGRRCGWRGKWGEMMMKEPCDYYSHIIIEDAEADERIQPMDTEAEVV